MNRTTQGWIGLVLAFAMTLAAPAFAADESAADSAAAQALAQSLKQDAVCTRCHDEMAAKPLLSIYQTRHGVKADERTPTCQSCHGKSEKHRGGAGETPGSTRPAPDIVFKTDHTFTPASDPRLQAQTCIACHKAGKRMHWDGSQHEARGVACGSCHSVHVKSDPVLTKVTQPDVCFACHKTERAQTHRISTHPLAAGKMACSDCHNPHGTTGPKLLARDSVNDTCYTCHAEKRGPFLWEHAPVNDDCTTCHTPHGSVNASLLKSRPPLLCQQCHSGDHGAQLNSAANLQNGNLTTVNGINPLANAAARIQLTARACLNCHVLVHGSNHPAGAKFQR